jgi:hypothetical protein
LKPDLVIPFKVDKNAAIAALQNHYKGKTLLPKVFKDQNHIEEVKGLYVPVWLFDTDADAFVQYRATRTRTWSDSEYNYTATDHYAVLRGGGIGFENVPVDGSTKMDDALMESIEPFNIADAVPFRTAYLPGYMADKYDVDAASSIDRANKRIKQSTEDAFRSTVAGYTSVTTVDSNIRLQNGKARYALYPVWILNTDWNGQKFTFAINGQTGKIAGDLPMDKGTFWKWLLGVSGAATAAAFAIREFTKKITEIVLTPMYDVRKYMETHWRDEISQVLNTKLSEETGKMSITDDAVRDALYTYVLFQYRLEVTNSPTEITKLLKKNLQFSQLDNFSASDLATIIEGFNLKAIDGNTDSIEKLQNVAVNTLKDLDAEPKEGEEGGKKFTNALTSILELFNNDPMPEEDDDSDEEDDKKIDDLPEDVFN